MIRRPFTTATGPSVLRSAPARLGLAALVVVIGYLVVAPLVSLQIRAFSGGAEGYRQAFSATGIGRTVLNTIWLALGSVALALVAGTLLAWAASRLPRRLRFLRIFPMLPLVLPAVASVVGWSFLASPSAGYLNNVLRVLPFWSGRSEGPLDVNSIEWIIFITGISLSAFVYVFVTSGLRNIGEDLQEAARVSGSGRIKVFFTVTLPLLRPSLVYAAGVVLLLSLGQLTAPLLLGSNAGVQVLTTEMYRHVSTTPVEYGPAAALGSPLLIAGIIVVLAQKRLLGGESRFVTHTGKGMRTGGGSSVFAVVVIVFYAAISSVLPLCALAFVSLSPYWTGKLSFAKLSLENFNELFAQPEAVSAIGNSVTYAVAAMAITLPLGFAVACVLIRGQRYRVMRVILDFLVSMPLGIPAVIFGAGFLITYTSRPFVLYGTPWVMILAYVTLMIPFATRMQLSTLLALGRGYIEASRASGAGLVRTYATIVLPLVRSSLAGSAALLFVLLTHEFTASLLVRSSTTRVMGTLLYDYWNNGSYPMVAAVALVMTAVTGAGVGLAMLLGGSDTLSKM
ncbi:ABC transporter permease [Streptomyces rapamycinicus]|uniref:Iron(III) transport system permease protein n=1 Tax=Streptomyces rapamycinicus TaxID=1226757 RepID=A0ABR6LGY8_9ACTN|nr:iron ABC transporter permease [Streptomyces rapamycinicus]MBB4781575.1 iron(III) transport system permease protein [Streptomyces rapamycinicus]UTO62169.1 iron ABC transporter permease [Streptomyces rapamycinicus]UTP30121.1 iron ABC transporter permease [Streptomyces rapamycinicus NRRL 5491]